MEMTKRKYSDIPDEIRVRIPTQTRVKRKKFGHTTTYKNIKFRSKLETKWAVFFDCMDMKYEYEPHIFDLGGVRYLPDFYLPDFGYAEVKYKGGDFSKPEKFVEVTKESIWLCEGTPEAKVYDLLYWDDIQVMRTKVTPLWDQGYSDNRFFYDPGYEDKDGYHDEDFCDMNPEYMEAVEAANNCKFRKRRLKDEYIGQHQYCAMRKFKQSLTTKL